MFLFDQDLMFHWYIPCAQKLITPSAQHNCISFFEFFTALDMHAESNVRGRGLEMTASFTILSFILLLLLDWPTTSLDADDNEALIDYSLSKKTVCFIVFSSKVWSTRHTDPWIWLCKCDGQIQGHSFLFIKNQKLYYNGKRRNITDNETKH